MRILRTHYSLNITPGLALFFLAGFAFGCAADSVQRPALPSIDIEYTETREPCAEQFPTRQAFFGDLHVHTSFSFDAGAYGNVLTPSDAYAFARGQAVKLPPLDAQGQGTRSVTIQRPLDFLSVTDHGDLLGEVALCTTAGSGSYDTPRCEAYRDSDGGGAFGFGVMLAALEPARDTSMCGDDGQICSAAASGRWQAMQDAAEAHYDRTPACKLTAFVGYEYTNTRGVSNLHRNVIFRNKNVTERPVSYFEAPRPLDLWNQLKSECLDGDSGCDVMSLPHNSNLSNGQLFFPRYPDATTPEAEAEIAALRAQMEPVTEVFQHKGDSECRNEFDGDAHDPFCDFEKLRAPGDSVCPDDMPGGGGMRLTGCVHRLDFLRHVLLMGLVEGERLGVNPYTLGMIGSTDTHNGTPGNVSTPNFSGHVGIVDDTAPERLGSGNITHDGIVNNPGGLAAVWAFENSRDAIFEAIRRRETFATSGPRIRPRLFMGTDFKADLCDDADRLAKAYAGGVPMGGRTTIPMGATPTLFMEAQGDDGGVMTPLERVQVVKGWIDQTGAPKWAVMNVAGASGEPERVAAGECAPPTEGPKRLCTVWSDPEFDPSKPAFYYLRVIEAPTCRWSTLQCRELAPEERPEVCGDPAEHPRVRHRAWTSPVWHSPVR